MESEMLDTDYEEWGGSSGILDDPAEQRVLYAALDSFYQYAKVAHYNTTHLRRQSFYALPQAHWQLLASPPFSYLDTLNSIDEAIDENAKLATAIYQSGLDSFGLGSVKSEVASTASKAPWHGTATSADVEKARSTIRQFFRDWSAEGAKERAVCYGRMIKDIKDEQDRRKDGKALNVLVPGAGLGRLVFELCRNGFNVEGNEISYHQLLASSYILNECPNSRHHIIYPWIHTFSNHLSRSHQLQPVAIPDVHPMSSLIVSDRPNEGEGAKSEQHDIKPGEMLMSASDFLLLYGDDDHKDVYDAVVTCFFLDTAPNFIRYIETIRNCLKQGGIWTNIGPLLWHFENDPPGKFGSGKVKEDGQTVDQVSGETVGLRDSENNGIADPGSVELTDDEVMRLVEKLGLKIEKQRDGIEAGYIQNPRSMMQSTYQVSHWVARKL